MKFNYDEKKIIGSFKGTNEELLQYVQNILNEDNLGSIDESKLVVVFDKSELDAKRDKELSGFIISDVAMNEDIIKTMAVQFNIAEEDETIEWIDINNQTVTFTKIEFGGLIKQGSQKVKEIYFKYRALKNELDT